MPQYFFVDESGDPGLHSFKGVPYFVLAMVQLPNRDPIDDFSRIRQALRVSPNFEFHFHPMTDTQKQVFFGSLKPIAFRVRAAVFLKNQIPPALKGLSGTDVVIELITELVLRASPLDIGDDVLVLDGAAEPVRKALRIHLSDAYKQAKRDRPFKKIVSGDSRTDDGLQLADMIAGAIRDFVWRRDSEYFDTFRNRVVDLWQLD
ncbi:MAG: DUF3800 domain-containing protein [Anaerolineales bacterium]